MMPRILNMRAIKEFDPQTMRYIGRGTPYGNPYPAWHFVEGVAIDLFERDVLPTLDVEPLRGYDLVCHCYPKPCHGQPIYKKLYGKEYTE